MSQTFSSSDQALVKALLMARRDVRGNLFSNQPISDAELEEILNAAIHAPSVGYSQPWRFVVVRDADKRRRIRDLFEQENAKAIAQFDGERAQHYQQLKLEGICEAPVSIAVFYCPSETPVLGQTSMAEMGPYSVVCAVQNMWLMARAMNIGIGWVSILDPQMVKRELGAPEAWQLVAWLCVGKTTQFLDKPELELKGWDQRKQLAQVLSYEQVERTACKP